jgi:hypothetical protein
MSGSQKKPKSSSVLGGDARAPMESTKIKKKKKTSRGK